MQRHRQGSAALAALALLLGGPGAARAQDARQVASTAEPAREAEAVPADTSAATRMEELEQRLRILERRLELEREAQDAAKASAATFTVGENGVQLRSADGSFQLRLRGYVQQDGRYFADRAAAPLASTLELRRVRPIIEATVFRAYDIRLMTDFGEGRVVIQDAHLDVSHIPQLRLRAGKFKPPVGLERLQSATSLLFVERALPTNLVPNRDIGIQLYGELARGVVSYAGGVFNGVPDGGSADLDSDGHKDWAGRLFLQPFRNTELGLLRGLGVGVAATRGRQTGVVGSTGLAGYRSPGQQSFFAYRADASAAGTTVADGRRTRLSPQGWLYHGPFGVIGEYVSARQQVRRGETRETLENRAWQAAGSWVLTGEDASFNGVRPRQIFDPRAKTWGALELVARRSELRVDDDAFPLFADPGRAAGEARAWGVGLNWYLNRNVKLSLDYDRTSYDGGAADGADRETEQALFTRIQLAF